MTAKKLYMVQAPVHQIFGFFVEAESAREAVESFRKSDPLRLSYTPTHDWREAPENVMDPIQADVFPLSLDNEDDSVELHTPYLEHLRRRFGGKPTRHRLRVASVYDAMTLISALDLFLCDMEGSKGSRDASDARIARRYMRQLHRILREKAAP